MFVPLDHPDGGFTVQARVSNKDIADLLSTAFEGGITGTWCVIVGVVDPPDVTIWSDRYDNGTLRDDPQLYRYYDYPVTPGGAVIVAEDEVWRDAEREGDTSQVKTFHIDRETIARGLSVMQTKYPHHFADFVKQNGDACTADVFVQCCVFGELVYG